MNKAILAIDIGSTKICAIIAQKTDGGVIQILGHGISKSQGVKKGSITNIELASKAIKKAVSDAKRISGNSISSATVSISDTYAKSLNSTGIVNIPHKDISIKEINRVMQTALYNANIPNEYDIIHVLPYNFKVDDQDFIEDPFGMNASRLEVNVNIIMTQKSNLANLKKAVKSAGVDIDGIVLNGYASAIATISDDDKELGVAVIDLGGQTSSLVIYSGNSIRHNDFFGVGSNHVTNDLSIALHTPLQVAENIKLRHGNLASISNEKIELPTIGNSEHRNDVSLEVIHNVIFARVEETLIVLAKMLEKSALREQIGAGVILTGGMTKLKGIRELAQAIFIGLPVRIASPNTQQVDGLFEELNHPSFSTAIGLLRYQIANHTEYEINFNQELLHSKAVLEEDLQDIKIDATINEIEISRQKKKITNKNQTEHEASTETKSKQDIFKLPKLPKERQNVFVKLFNWAKQLF